MKKMKPMHGWMAFLVSLGLVFVLNSCRDALSEAGASGSERNESHDEEGHGEEGHEEGDHDVVTFSEKELSEFGVELAKAGPAELTVTENLPGEVMLDPDRVAHVVPVVAGRAIEVLKTVGDKVKKGEPLVVLDSRELASLKADYLAALARVKLARSTFEREKKLFEQKISSEQDYLNAETALKEALIELRSAEHKLVALGFTRAELAKFSKHKGRSLSRFVVRAPISGTVVERHVTLGERVSQGTRMYVIADTSVVWVYLTVYQKDLELVRPGQRVLVRSQLGSIEREGRIDFVSPTVDESTRTARARVVLENEDGALKPGMFVTGLVEMGATKVPIGVPRSAVIEFRGDTVVFVKTAKGFVPRPVKLGRSDGTWHEVVEGLEPGEVYVKKGALTLKAELQKAELGEGHGH